jgi:hypothetical protein
VIVRIVKPGEYFGLGPKIRNVYILLEERLSLKATE